MKFGSLKTDNSLRTAYPQALLVNTMSHEVTSAEIWRHFRRNEAYAKNHQQGNTEEGYARRHKQTPSTRLKVGNFRGV